jgi:hypothetical protein
LKTARRLGACVAVLLVACDSAKNRPEDDATGEPGRPRNSKTTRIPVVSAPEQRQGLRQALEAAKSSATQEESHRRVAEVAWNAMELEPELAMEAIASLPPDHEERILLLQHLVMRMAEDNPDQAIAWAAALATESETAAAYAQIALVLAETDPERAAMLLSETGIEGHDFDVAVVQVLQRWADQSPPAAAAWVAAFPPGDFRAAGIQEILTRWVQSDPEAGMQWSSSQNDESLTLDAKQAVARIIHEEDEPLRSRLIDLADPQILEHLRELERQAAEDAEDAEPMDEESTGPADP